MGLFDWFRKHPTMPPIMPGVGVGDCRIKANKQAAVALLGTPSDKDPSGDMPGYLDFPKSGVQVRIGENDQIETIFLFFRSASHAAYDGVTDRGIGRNSTFAEVIGAYGTPSSQTDFASSGSKTASYDDLGITFSFAKQLLGDIRIQEPRALTWPKEWPERPSTDACCWMAFVGEEGSWLRPIAHAQASFLEFARIVELENSRILPTFENISIKAFFESIPGNPMFGEHIYLTDVSTNGKTITATLNASAFRRSDLKEGNVVTFPIENLSDWYLVRMGKGYGGFTISEVWAQLSEEEQNQARESPPFSWYSERKITAEEQLIALPQCRKCNRRNLMLETEMPEGVCAICRQGGHRCDCQKCGAPLIRFDKMPDLCRSCAANGKSSASGSKDAFSGMKAFPG